MSTQKYSILDIYITCLYTHCMTKAKLRGPQFNLRFSDEEMERLKGYCERMSQEAGNGAVYTMTRVTKDALFEKIGAQEERWKRQGRK